MEVSWTVYQCESTGAAFRGGTVAFLLGIGLDFGWSANTGFAFGAQDKYQLEGIFVGADINFAPGFGLGLGVWDSDTAFSY